MTLSIETGGIFVHSSDGTEYPMDVCVIWLENAEWSKLPFPDQKNVYAFTERLHRAKHIFYCLRTAPSVFELQHITPASEGKLHLSTETLKKVFARHLIPKIKNGSMETSTLAVPRL